MHDQPTDDYLFERRENKRTGWRVKVHYMESFLQQVYARDKARSLDSVLVQVIGVAARIAAIIQSDDFNPGGRQSLYTYFDVITHTTPACIKDSSSRLRIIASTISVT